MYGLGTVINPAAIVAGGLGGAVFGRFLRENVQDTLTKVCGVSTLFIAVKNTVRRKGDYYATARREQLQAVSSFGCKTSVGVWFSAAQAKALFSALSIADMSASWTHSTTSARSIIFL